MTSEANRDRDRDRDHDHDRDRDCDCDRDRDRDRDRDHDVTVTVCRHLEDNQISTFLDRKIEELSPVEHAILRISSFELMFDMSIPYRVAIYEGVELAKLYGGADGHKYINGVLDRVAASVRPQEFRK
jgi:transcription antitermination factor NusB